VSGWRGRITISPTCLAFRYIRDSTTTTDPQKVYFPGLVTDSSARNQNFHFTDHYTFSASWTNEFRFSYGWQESDGPERISPQSVPQAQTLPYILIAGTGVAAGGVVSAPGIRSNFLQGRQTNNLLFQETQSKLIGCHTFRYGAEFLRQLASQRPASFFLRVLTYNDAPTPLSPTFWTISADPLVRRRRILARRFSIRTNSTRLTFSRTPGCRRLR
jgi:hypothetical protein